MADQSKQAIMLVDDDRFLLDMYSAKFAQAGFQVESCQSVSEALALLRGGQKPTVILFDIVMPGQDGFAFLRAIAEEKLADGSLLIALTNQSNDSDKTEAEKFSIARYVVKASMIPSEVVAMVQEELARNKK